MKVLHFYRTYFPDTQGGLEEAIRQICLGTQAHAVESRVLTLSPDPTPSVLQRPEAEVVRTRLDLDIASCSMSLAAFAEFQRLADWADVLHFHFPWPFADLVKFCTRPSKPYLITYHSDIVRQKWLGRLYAPLMRNFLSGSSAIVATSPNYFATSRVLQNYASKVRVIPIGVHEDFYPVISSGELASARDTYGEGFFLFVGVLRHYKGLHILLEALRDAPYRVLIVGTGPEEEELKRQAQRLGLNNIVFTGYLPDRVKLALFQLSLALVFPSHLRSEAFGVTLLEAAMMSRPLISAEIGTGTSFINIDGETGVVIPPADAAALRRAMDSLHADPERARKLGLNARRRYERFFTAVGMGGAYAELYDEIAAGVASKSSGPDLADSA